MIAYIKGKLIATGLGSALLEAGGVGISLLIPISTTESLPAVGEEALLYTHLHWRDEGPQLYGFTDIAQVELFVRLLGVSGIGPKLALGVLGYASVERVLVWLIHEDYQQLRKIPGVGLKTAQRMVLELKEKAQTMAQEGEVSVVSLGQERDSPMRQAMEALISLGFDSSRASQVLTEVSHDQAQGTLEQLLAAALKRLP